MAQMENRMTQKQLADAVAMPLITYATKENERPPFDEKEITKICKVLVSVPLQA